MANAKQCDICGDFYAAHRLSRQLRGCGVEDTAAIVLIDPNPNANYLGEVEEDREQLETCPNCMARIKEFIAAMKENKKC